jgi:hypothetical protein
MTKREAKERMRKTRKANSAERSAGVNVHKKSETLNPFERYGGKHHRPDRLILFDDDPRNEPWLDALEAFDHGDKSVLVALLKSGYPMLPMS